MKILIAEDDRDMSKAVTAMLKKNNFSVDPVYNGKDALACVLNGDYDAAILDIMMPGMSGIDVVKKAREKNVSMPIMMLTAMGEIDDKVNGLEAGADDYLTKPFSGKELLARLRAILRRIDQFTPNLLHYKDITLDCNKFTLSCGDKSVNLGNKGFQMMEMFMRSPNQLISTNQIMEHVWGWDSDSEINVVWVNISFLRKQLKNIGSQVEINAARGVGYTLGDRDA